MKKLCKRLLFFIIPFIIYLGLVIVADPYNYWNHCRVMSLDTKLSVSRKLNERLWKIIQFKRAPKSNILLGDSRVYNINSNRIKELTGEDYFNFAYPGGTLSEVNESFWFATKQIQLKNVIIGCNFNLYNEYNNKNLVTPTLKSASAIRYVLNGANIKALAVSLYYWLSDKKATIGTPDMPVDAFWEEQLEQEMARFYRLYKYPEGFHTELQEIANYCHKNDIRLILFIPPTHTDLQKKVKEYSLTKESERFKADLKAIAGVIDYDYDTWLTRNRENFTDPFHLDLKLDTILINGLIRNKIIFGTYLDNELSR